ncbi:MAG: CRISPR-associated protein Cas5 [Cloacibacillus porcorum]|uniref:CRISPR-associated protein Cas5 n=1 Tax=Cloacibacillus porcorum TaxID=1197717 RepID=UPI0023F11F49|nr:CRISPR-associated protein Cas5 [Cloacibacillus porcorum]MCD7877294.1 CRISPR-associated protein Cas5 [Cloacibacillus porcorum]
MSIYHSSFPLSSSVNDSLKRKEDFIKLKQYMVSCEIAGRHALFSDPSMGDSPGSYPVPTASAVCGIFSAVNWGPAVTIIPQKVEICSPIRFENYITNYGGPLRHSGSISGDNNYQLLASILVDVCYKLHASVRPLRQNREKMTDGARRWDANTTSPGHAYNAIFERRLKRGQFFHTPCLEWKEFTPTYFGPLRETTSPCKEINLVIPSLLMSVFPDGYDSKPRFAFAQNVEVREGVMFYPQEEASCNAE